MKYKKFTLIYQHVVIPYNYPEEGNQKRAKTLSKSELTINNCDGSTRWVGDHKGGGEGKLAE